MGRGRCPASVQKIGPGISMPLQPKQKWGPALLPAPTAPSEGYAGVRSTLDPAPERVRPRFSILAHQLRRRIPSDYSLFRGARLISRHRHPKARASLDWPGLNGTVIPFKTVRCSAALLGKPSIAFRFAHLGSEDLREPRRTTGRFLFRRLFPAGPGKDPKIIPNCLPAEIGPLVACRVLLAVAGLPGRRGLPSRSPDDNAPSPRVAKAESSVRSLWIMWISGTTAVRD